MLNRSILLLLFFISISFKISAQKFYAGIIGGMAATQISGDQLSGFDKPGIAAGGFAGTTVSEKFDVVMQILYIQKGSKKNADPDNGDYVAYKLRLNYFEVPLLLHWKYSKRFIIEAGPTFGALLSSYEEDEFGEIPERRPFKSFEFGGILGLNVTIVDQLRFNVRTGRSILPVREHLSGESYRLNAGQFNSSLMFSLQYRFSAKPAE